jgi:hypothetical protein
MSAALRSFCKALPGRVTELRTMVAEAHLGSTSFNLAFDACLASLLKGFQQENARPDPLRAFPEHIATWKPELDASRLDDLLVQLLLLERFFRCAFPDAFSHNEYACQVNSVLGVLYPVRDDALGPLESSYLVVEQAYRTYDERAQRQQIMTIFFEQFIGAYDCHYSHGFAEHGKHGLAAKCLVFLKRTGKTSKSACSFRGMKNGEEAWVCRKTSGIQEFLPVLPAVLASCLFFLTEPCRAGRLRKHRYRNAARPMGKKTTTASRLSSSAPSIRHRKSFATCANGSSRNCSASLGARFPAQGCLF